MHNRFLVTITMPEGSTSEDARRKVFNDLLNDHTFCGEGGRFSSPLCDWFVIGGRWSGLLGETTIGPAHRQALVARIPELDAEYFPSTLVEKHRETLDAIWHVHGRTGPSPYTRSGYDEFEDDAMVVTQKLYDALLAKYAGEVGVIEEFIDLDDEAVEPGFVNRKWLIVVDYHN